MAQTVDFNWAIKVKHPNKVKSGEITAIVKNGVRIFPLYESSKKWIDLIDWNKNIIGKVIVQKLIIKSLDDLLDSEANAAGFTSKNDLVSFLECEYKDKKNENIDVVTIIYFKIIQR